MMVSEKKGLMKDVSADEEQMKELAKKFGVDDFELSGDLAQQHATGNITGKKGEKELSDEERITEGDRVFHRHEPVFKDLASQHHDFVRHLYSINPMFKTHIDTLKNHFGADLEKISHNLFSDAINAKTQALITHFAFNTSMRPTVS